jgi:hypothetical protein
MGVDWMGELGELRPNYAIAMSACGAGTDIEHSLKTGYHLAKSIWLEKLAAVLAEADEFGFR